MNTFAGSTWEEIPHFFSGYGGERVGKRVRGKKLRWTEHAKQIAMAKGVVARRKVSAGRRLAGVKKRERLEMARKQREQLLSKMSERKQKLKKAEYAKNIWRATRMMKNMSLENGYRIGQSVSRMTDNNGDVEMTEVEENYEIFQVLGASARLEKAEIVEKKYGMAQIAPDRNANDVQIMDGGMFRLCDDQDWDQNENWCEKMEIDGYRLDSNPLIEKRTRRRLFSDITEEWYGMDNDDPEIIQEILEDIKIHEFRFNGYCVCQYSLGQNAPEVAGEHLCIDTSTIEVNILGTSGNRITRVNGSGETSIITELESLESKPVEQGLERHDLEKVLQMEDLPLVFKTCLFEMEPGWGEVSILENSIIDDQMEFDWLDRWISPLSQIRNVQASFMMGEELLEHMWLEMMSRQASCVGESLIISEIGEPMIIDNKETILTSTNETFTILTGSLSESRTDHMEHFDEEPMELQMEQTSSNKEILRELHMPKKDKVNTGINISLGTCSLPIQARMLLNGEVRKQVDLLNLQESMQELPRVLTPRSETRKIRPKEQAKEVTKLIEMFQTRSSLSCNKTRPYWSVRSRVSSWWTGGGRKSLLVEEEKQGKC